MKAENHSSTCDFSCYGKCIMKNHITSDYEGNKHFKLFGSEATKTKKCMMCEETFSFNRNLQKHIKIVKIENVVPNHLHTRQSSIELSHCIT